LGDCDHADGRAKANRDAMGAVPGTVSRRNESQAPSPRSFEEVVCCRKVVPAQCRARHAPVSGVSRGHGHGYGHGYGYGCEYAYGLRP